MTPPDPTKAALEALAKKLTAGQRQAIVDAKKSFASLSLTGQPSTLHSLKRKGITDGPFADRFTDPLGLALREHLLELDSRGREG